MNKSYVVGKSKIHGRGVFAEINIPKYTKIVEYDGEKVSRAEGTRRHNLQSKKGRFYIFELNKQWDIDGSKGGPGKLINHSCTPTCYYTIKRGKIWICAKRNIHSGEELTYNYDVLEKNMHPCNCKAKNCTGLM